ncbi:hypothetical protein K491DRAFT_605306 [Lophiostoma macrostomum CBS 122681]|uniref:CSI2 protein n=1 Tax=Lophiostoma macrostomum CBS 122681 TaxID=1314788 RepID=A0A6A6SXH6_9PLEO|nr:hypothetical protein K491DRAFT_605306 [Lophiostoma macrostomum CBS 122681]
MRPSAGLVGLLLLLAPAVLAQEDGTTAAATAKDTGLPNLSTVSQPDGAATTTAQPSTTDAPSSTEASSTSNTADSTVTHPTDLPTFAGYGTPDMVVPDTSNAPFMQKSNLPDGTVFICVGAALGAFLAAVLIWRGMVAWSLHRSVQRAAMAQNLADHKAMMDAPGRKRGMYNVVGGNSTLSLDRLSAAPTGISRPSKPFTSDKNTGTPPKNTSLFFSPTAGGTGGVRDSVNRSSTYLPAGYYQTGSAQPASGSPVTHVGGHGHHLSTHSLQTPGNRMSTRSGISPPLSPSLPPSSRGYDRARPSNDNLSMYNRNSVATLGTPGTSRGLYGHEHGNVSQLSLNVPGGSSVAGGRAPSTYLEDLFENHGNGPRER